MAEQLKKGELKRRMLTELLKYHPEHWVRGTHLSEVLGSKTRLSGVMHQVRGLVETRMGQYGGYRLTPRGRRHAQALVNTELPV